MRDGVQAARGLRVRPDRLGIHQLQRTSDPLRRSGAAGLRAPANLRALDASIEQIELRALALEEVQTMDGLQFVIYFSDHDYEIVCIDDATAFEYNPMTDILIGE